MRIIRRGKADRNPAPDPTLFTGPVQMTPLHQPPPNQAAGVAIVHFSAGARSRWHRHAGGQVLHVIEGSGMVQVEGEEPQALLPGDTVVAPPGEKHWHGSDGKSAVSHMSIAAGEAEWLEEPPPYP